MIEVQSTGEGVGEGQGLGGFSGGGPGGEEPRGELAGIGLGAGTEKESCRLVTAATATEEMETAANRRSSNMKGEREGAGGDP